MHPAHHQDIARQVRVLQGTSLALGAALAAFVTLGLGPQAPAKETRVEKFDEIGGIASADGMRIISLDDADYPIEALALASGGQGERQGTTISLKQPPSGAKVDLAAAGRGYKTLQSIWKSGLDGDAADAEAERRAQTDPDLAEVLRQRKLMVNRIGIGVDPKEAGISLADRDGNDRIVMRVTDTGEPEIVMLDADGKEVARIPERKEKP